MPAAAHTTLRAVAAVAFAVPAALSAVCFAAAGDTAAVVLGTDIRALVALLTPFSAPFFAVWTTRSPPSTGRPAYVRS